MASLTAKTGWCLLQPVNARRLFRPIQRRHYPMGAASVRSGFSFGRREE
jgi:hypothetical protein